MWYCRVQKEFAFEIASLVVSTKRVMQSNIEHEYMAESIMNKLVYELLFLEIKLQSQTNIFMVRCSIQLNRYGGKGGELPLYCKSKCWAHASSDFP